MHVPVRVQVVLPIQFGCFETMKSVALLYLQCEA